MAPVDPDGWLGAPCAKIKSKGRIRETIDRNWLGSHKLNWCSQIVGGAQLRLRRRCCSDASQIEENGTLLSDKLIS